MAWYSTLTLAQESPAPVTPGSDKPAAPATTDNPAAPGAPSTATGKEPAKPVKPPGFFDSPMFFVVIFLLIMWVMLLLPQKREKKKHAALIASLKKGDRVQTIGGILGTVLEVRDKDVLVKVDEASNAKIRFTRAAIQGVVAASEKE